MKDEDFTDWLIDREDCIEYNLGKNQAAGKNADEMFEELGYKKREVYNGYLYTNDTGFNIKITNMRRIDLYYDSEEEKYENLIQLTFGELQAINKKVEELGWI